ncbi:MAG TPA: hypothetical protein VJ749_11385 [Pyrinomonadaceae bacterium]|nr:hypothetical protein [Pyrinomonadaceae bacterium]
MTNSRMRRLLLLLSIGIVAAALQARPVDEKLSPADLVAKHLDSIGSPEARARSRGTLIKGSAQVTVKLCGEGQVDGEVALGSQGPMNVINLKFNTPAYPFESLVFDGKKFSASQFKPGSRTCLAQFFLANDAPFKEGLIGGTLSESWPLLNLTDKNPKLEYAGLKKIGDRQLHALKYTPRKGSDLKITLYFEPENFRHVRTEYSRTIYASEQRKIGSVGPNLPPEQRQQASAARIDAYEEFADFKPENGLNLPHTYTFHLSIQSEVRPAVVDWVFNLTTFAFDAPLNPAEFVR